MLDERIFADLNEKYADVKGRFDEVLLQQRSKAVRTVYSKVFFKMCFHMKMKWMAIG